MSNNKRFNISNIFHSGVANLRLNNIQIKCVFNKLENLKFKHFVNALSKISKFDSNKNIFSRTCVRIIFGYYAIQFMHDSSYVNYLFQKGRSFSFPSFVHVILIGISTASKTNNKITGTTYGSLKCLDSLQDVIDDLLESDSSLTYLLSGTVFQPLLNQTFDPAKQPSTQYDLTDLKNEIRTYISQVDYSEDTKDFDLITFFLSDFRLGLYYSDNLEVTHHVYTTVEQSNYGIYKYRNHSIVSDTYYVQQSSITSVGEAALQMQIAFLRLFDPSFNSANNLIGGDLELDVSVLDFTDAWTIYFKLKVINSSSNIRTTNSTSNRRVKSNDLNKSRNFEDMNNNLSDDINDININNFRLQDISDNISEVIYNKLVSLILTRLSSKNLYYGNTHSKRKSIIYMADDNNVIIDSDYAQFTLRTFTKDQLFNEGWIEHAPNELYENGLAVN